LSDYAYERAVTLRLITLLNDEEKEEFKKEVQKQLGLAQGQDRDSICSAMDDQEFENFAEYVKQIIRSKKKQRETATEQSIDA
jgi:hypothetical protein